MMSYFHPHEHPDLSPDQLSELDRRLNEGLNKILFDYYYKQNLNDLAENILKKFKKEIEMNDGKILILNI